MCFHSGVDCNALPQWSCFQGIWILLMANKASLVGFYCWVVILVRTGYPIQNSTLITQQGLKCHKINYCNHSCLLFREKSLSLQDLFGLFHSNFLSVYSGVQSVKQDFSKPVFFLKDCTKLLKNSITLNSVVATK